MKRILMVGLLALLLIGGSQARAQTPDLASAATALKLLVHPDYPPDQARLVYQPLVDYLRAATRLNITLEVDRNFHRYWLNARRNETPTLILEQAHMVAWRMQQHGFRPLVTTAAPRTFSLLTSGALADDPLNAFIGRRIASLPSPSLGYLVLARWFQNPLQQPIIQSSARSWLDAVEMVFSAEADAAIAPDNLAQRYPNLYAVATSREFPGLTLNAAPSVSDEVAQVLIDALVVLHDDPEHHSALFELDVDRFVVADPAAYRGLEDWLSGLFQL
ncbi:MAG: PhnD/SsuA/transferrin family substrate-binding protein [Wenzhouxiangellaceae bacterium]|nr:PhnD/SsuA/transferrin family substrate-binding protein [Wenzhouxiangellaceae bacterium]